MARLAPIAKRNGFELLGSPGPPPGHEPARTKPPTDNGPYLVEGPVRILDADGTAYDLPEQTAIFLWRCGGSGTKPFCDGTHLTRRFEAAHRVGHTAGAS